MKILFYIERIGIIHQLVASRKTGTPAEMAVKLHISVSRLAKIIDELRDLGAPIRYDRCAKTYYYAYPYNISVNISFG